MINIILIVCLFFSSNIYPNNKKLVDINEQLKEYRKAEKRYFDNKSAYLLPKKKKINSLKINSSPFGKTIKVHERNLQKMLLGKIGDVELLKSATEAKQSLQTALLIRNELFKALEKILSMPI